MLEYYKEPGITPLEFINNIKKHYPDTKICYTARLDPMARGIIPVLFGEECKNMHNYTNLSKTYEVKVMIGYKTDSDDVLGILEPQVSYINNLDSNTISSHEFINKYKSYFEIEIKNEITNNTITQKYHYFSTKALLARSKNKDVDTIHTNTEYSHSVKLFTSKIIESGELDFKEWINECITIIDKVDKTKDFRQKKIIEQWTKYLQYDIKNIQYIKLQLHVGSGFFVRQYIHDISDKIGIPLMCYDIHRVSIDYKFLEKT
jgi:tRNA U55 pseudouridine synthase TruB